MGSQIKHEIYQLPHHINTLEVHNPYKDKDHYTLERDKCVMKTFSYNRKKLKRQQAHVYEITTTASLEEPQ